MNLRVIKKDVNYLIDEFISDALISLTFIEDDQKTTGVIDLTNQALELQEEILCKISHPDGNKRAYYRNLMDSLLSALDALYDKLSEVVSKKN